MKLIVHIAILSLAAVVIIGGIVFVVIDMFTRVDYLRDKFSWLGRVLEWRGSLTALVVVATCLLIGDGYELTIKEVPEVPAAPTFIVKAPLAPVVQIQGVLPSKEPKDSLRRRTMQVADELYDYLKARAEGQPPAASPNSNDPNPSEERKKEIQTWQKYQRETEDYYSKNFRDRMVGIVKEYESKGVSTHYLENDFKQRVPGVMAIGSGWEGSPMDELSQFRDLAYRVDARDHLIVFR
jgi:hypothetical protein